jgi:nucleotide-binding universal stress UspA family protein
MTLVVPFDGSELSKAALVRAAQFDTVLDDGVLAVSAVPRHNAQYARDRGWIGPNDPFDAKEIESHLREAAHDIAPEATFETITVDRWARTGLMGKKLRRFARDADASIVFLGSENAGRFVRSNSVGSAVAADRSYDTMIVTNTRPSRIERLEAEMPTEQALE